MRKLMFPLALAVLFLIAGFGALSVARGNAEAGPNGEVVLKSETQDGNTRQITAPEGAGAESLAPEQPDIGFIDSPTVACVQPDRTKNECFINFYYLSVSASPSSIISMTVRISDFGNVARYNGFFQTSMYVPFNMNSQGFKVPCGALNSGGVPGWGKSYALTIRARDSANLGSTNYATAICPAYIP